MMPIASAIATMMGRNTPLLPRSSWDSSTAARVRAGAAWAAIGAATTRAAAVLNASLQNIDNSPYRSGHTGDGQSDSDKILTIQHGVPPILARIHSRPYRRRR